MGKKQKWVLVVWLGVVAVCLGSFWIHPEWLEGDRIRVFLDGNFGWMMGVYVFLSLVRGVFLIPSTPFVLAGMVVFPGHPFWVFWVSMAGIWASALFAYFFSEWLGLDRLAEGKHQAKYERVRARLDRHGWILVAFWAFFPAVPTDLICYAAGAMRMHLGKFLFGVTLGEVPLVAMYVWTGQSLWAYLLG